ncbi:MULTISPECIES: DUF211 domain-containing protein [Methanohalophilus]|jgi:hypothetical protein|uniref:DUF211 domain-containing protein n=1 Tax=Methanohalophilus euhalobius TaxID=51203 RepID=A0A285GGC5_9EURY|nr:MULTISPECIES: DUF211 domain-containing protein [Methanohalophilus]KXS41798.1 MAG: hypothetical protein AWU58_1633 [Methanohalophilus sp. T328-1]RSD35313.1 MAG: hypothetical protein CI953_246 [Methanohalophilus sp.]OBZ34363.1 MAG: hypothetical protein A9957_03235 [Methanohalophilus sp. DAL1]ODV49015.1 MAG: hypothetical protein A8273_1685 [Methanohalophilus sp. 2-GBenrich]PQV42510.1 hypothetical protein B0H22_106158 [Methanohalophilus euhalobius]
MMNNKSGIRRLVLDVLKPHNPSIVELAGVLGDLEGVDGVNLSLYEMDQKTENVKITLEGLDLDYELIRQEIENMGAVVHSVDEIAAGKKIIEEVETHQDR